MALLSMEVQVKSMWMLFIMCGLDHVGIDFLNFTYYEKCNILLPTALKILHFLWYNIWNIFGYF